MKKLTPYMQENVRFALKSRREGKPNKWISKKLKITRERVRQILKMAN